MTIQGGSSGVFSIWAWLANRRLAACPRKSVNPAPMILFLELRLSLHAARPTRADSGEQVERDGADFQECLWPLWTNLPAA
jgi:hypothetical protein